MEYLKLILPAAAVVSAIVGFGAASAADLPVRTYTKAPAMVANPTYNWSGFYIGVHGGGAWSDGASNTDPTPAATWNRSRDFLALHGSGGLAGVHAGYNWQFAPTALVGVEADGSWTKANASETVQDRDGTGVTFPGPTPTTMSRDLNWLAGVRARMGFILNNSVLLYGTGGVAWGGVHYRSSLISFPALVTWTADSSATGVGLVVGAGAEWMISPNWMLRGEYLFYRLSGESILANGVPPLPPFQVNYNWDRFDTHVGRVGLSYKFGGPVVAKY